MNTYSKWFDRIIPYVNIILLLGYIANIAWLNQDDSIKYDAFENFGAEGGPSSFELPGGSQWDTASGSPRPIRGGKNLPLRMFSFVVIAAIVLLILSWLYEKSQKRFFSE